MKMKIRKTIVREGKKKKKDKFGAIIINKAIDNEIENNDESEVGGQEIGTIGNELGPTARGIEGCRGTNLWDSQKKDNKQSLLPGANDPRLWMVKCRRGEERATACQLMKKLITSQSSSEPFRILSAVAPKGIKGYIYIKAFKLSDVEDIIKDIKNLISSWKP